MIEWIILLVIWIVLTEIIFFVFARKDYDFGDSFLSKKFFSLFISFVITFFSVGFPTLLAYGPREPPLEPIGAIAYFWYYGIILALMIFFGINYLIYKFVNRDLPEK